MTSSLSPKLVRFFMHVIAVLDLILFWIACIAVWLFIQMVIFSFKVFSTISFFAALAIAKTSGWKTVAYYVFQVEKILICMRAVRVETRASSSV